MLSVAWVRPGSEQQAPARTRSDVFGESELWLRCPAVGACAGNGEVGVRRDCEARITIEAPVEDVWNVISDVTRVGEWSGECCQLQLAPAL